MSLKKRPVESIRPIYNDKCQAEEQLCAYVVRNRVIWNDRVYKHSIASSLAWGVGIKLRGFENPSTGTTSTTGNSSSTVNSLPVVLEGNIKAEMRKRQSHDKIFENSNESVQSNVL